MRRVALTPSTRVHLSFALAVLLGAAALPGTTQAITIGVQASGGGPGDSVEVQIVLSGGNGLVAGMQTDIAWDSNCLSVASGSGDTAACYANTAIPKTLSTKIRSGSSLRALYLSMSDVEPIAQDTWLFTCQFTIDPATSATQCPVTLTNLVVSDSKGGRLPATAASGVVRVNQPNAPNAPAQRAPVGVPGAVVIPGGGAAGGSGQGSGSGAAPGSAPAGAAPAGAAPAGGTRGGGSIVVPGLPSGQGCRTGSRGSVGAAVDATSPLRC